MRKGKNVLLLNLKNLFEFQNSSVAEAVDEVAVVAVEALADAVAVVLVRSLVKSLQSAMFMSTHTMKREFHFMFYPT